MDGTSLRWRDGILPLGLAGLVVVELLALDGEGRLGAGIVLLLGCAALVPRRRHPVASGVAVGACCVGMPWLGPAIDEVATPILLIAVASYSMGRWVRGYAGVAGLAVVLAMMLFDYATVDLRAHNVTDAVFLAALLVPPYVFGRITQRLADYNALLRREQDLVRRAAVRDERDRIARELHDVIAHSVSAMVVQISVAEDLVDRDPPRARGVLESAAGTGRRALAETGRLLHVIRDSGDELGLAPVPGLADVPALVEDHRRGGLRVELTGDAAATDLPAAVDVSAYRVVAEALTNAERYAAGRAVEIELRADRDDFLIRATNASSGASGAGSGLGLVGVAERVALLGGTMTTTDEGGRFVLEVRLPVRDGVQEPA